MALHKEIIAPVDSSNPGTSITTQGAVVSPPMPNILIVGGGFGGIAAARGLADAPVRITLIDRRNHHLFQPLLYQVATTALAASDIAWPIRSLLRHNRNVTTLLGEVTSIDTSRKQVFTKGGAEFPYDTLILATGAREAYFGHDQWEPFAPGLKSIEDATNIRRRILVAFEDAEGANGPTERERLLTFVIVGGGPTGVELAGTIAELAKDTLHGEFRNFDTRDVRVVLVEAGPRILPGFREVLSTYAKRELERLGVEVLVGVAVDQVNGQGVIIGGKELPAKTVLWAAGVQASAAAAWLGAPSDRTGRVMVESNLTLPGHPDIFVIGDTAHVKEADGKLVPGIAPAAKQEGRYVAKLIKARLKDVQSVGPFEYKNAGSLATVGKRAAVVDFGWFKLTGRVAWWFWGLVHIYFLIGFRNRLTVALSWLWNYLTGQRSARLITQTDAKGGAPDEEHNESIATKQALLGRSGNDARKLRLEEGLG